MPAPPVQQDWLWTLPQRRALIALLVILCVSLGVRLAFNPAYIPDPPMADGPRAKELASRLDPNTASWEELAAIPTLGEKRAKAIVAFRDGQIQQHPGQIVFKAPDDLTRVKGIRQATASNIQAYLSFPSMGQ